MTPALTPSSDSIDIDTVSESAYSADMSYRSSPAPSSSSAQPRYTTPSPQMGLGIALPSSEPPRWSKKDNLTVPRRSSSRLSNHSAPGSIQRRQSPEVPEEFYPSPASTQESPVLSSNYHSHFIPSDTVVRQEGIIPQFARSRPIYLPPLRVYDPQEHQQIATQYEAAASEWDQRQCVPRFPDMPRFSVEPASPLHRFDLHAPSPTYPQYL